MARKTRNSETVSLMPIPGFRPKTDGNATFHKGVPMLRGRQGKSLDFYAMIRRGENTTGFTAQTPNGTAKSGHHPGWNQESKFTMPEAQRRGPWKGNRSGE